MDVREELTFECVLRDEWEFSRGKMGLYTVFWTCTILGVRKAECENVGRSEKNMVLDG